jgi:hypothetical protein
MNESALFPWGRAACGLLKFLAGDRYGPDDAPIHGRFQLSELKSFELRKSDRDFLTKLAEGFRALLRVADISPEAIVGLARALRLIERIPDLTPGIDVEVVLDFESASGDLQMTTNTTIHLSTDEITAEKSGGSDAGFGFESFGGFYYSLSVDDGRDHEGSMKDFAAEFAACCGEAATEACYSIEITDNSEPGLLPPGPERS